MKNQDNKKEDKSAEDESTKARRDFLKKSSYAAYATPVITAMFIKKAEAVASYEDKG